MHEYVHRMAPEPAATAHERANGHEAERAPAPAIYVASLADYNNGILHGEWIDAARDAAEIHADIAAMLARSRQPDAEEFAIHDYEQFGSCRIHEYDSIETVSRIARGISEHGFAFAAWAEVNEGLPERFDDFADAYLGHYGTIADYAEQFFDDIGIAAKLAELLPESLHAYIRLDSDALGRDLELSGEVHALPAEGGGVWLFDSRV